MKITRIINEGKLIEFDKESFEKAAYSLIKKLLKKLPFSVNLDSVSINRIEKTKSPITFDVNVEIIVSGSNIVAKYADDQKGNQVSINYRFYGLPGNTYITEDILKNLPRYNDTIEQSILKDILYYVSTTDDIETRKSVYTSKEQEIKNIMHLLENKYSVKLHFRIYPDIDQFSQDSEGYYSIYVYVLEINNSLGRFIKQGNEDYEYTINNIRYSSFLQYKDNHIIGGYGWYETHVKLADLSMDDLYKKNRTSINSFLRAC